jgi:hypothetical protein
MTSAEVRLQNTPVIPGCVQSTQTRNPETGTGVWIPGSLV